MSLHQRGKGRLWRPLLGRRKVGLTGAPLCDSATAGTEALFMPSGGLTEPGWGVDTQNPNTVLCFDKPFSF